MVRTVPETVAGTTETNEWIQELFQRENLRKYRMKGMMKKYTSGINLRSGR